MYQKADIILSEANDFKRKVTLQNPTKRMILITSIAKPSRLDPYLPDLLEKIVFPDHYFFTKDEILALILKYQASSIVCTQKDAVKLAQFGVNLSLLKLEILLQRDIYSEINQYLENF